jgi:peptidoglycan/LPS O-acetylase OafA/YrhL
MSSQRYQQLDALRGLAALAVVFHHCLLIPSAFDESLLAKILKSSPLGIARAGSEAVNLFFVLSGFVLALQLYYSDMSYPQYLIRRICRIWIPYISTIAFAIALIKMINPITIPELGSWFNQTWTQKLTTGLVLQHILLIGSFHNYSINTAMWSLVQEMRISIAFPIIPLILGHIKATTAIMLAVLVMLIGILSNQILHPFLGDYADWTLTITCTGLFIIGATLAKHRVQVIERYKSLPMILKGALLTVAALSYTIEYWPPIARQLHCRTVMTALGAVLFVAIAIASPMMKHILAMKPLPFIGKISFSIYLLHGNVLFAYVHLLHRVLPLWVIWGLTFATTLPLAALSYYFIEKPGISLGYRLSTCLTESLT